MVGEGMHRETSWRAPASGREWLQPSALLALLLVAATPWTPAASARADGTPLRDAEQVEANFAFSHRLGSGVYEISGRTVQIYRLPFEWTWREPEGERPGLAVTLPLTLGFFGFKVQDVIETGLPSDISTLSFVPGVRATWRIGEHWRLRPFAEAGVAVDRTEDLRSRVLTVGGDAEWRGPWPGGDGRYRAALEYSTASIDDLPGDDYALLVNGVELTRPLPARLRGRRLDIAPYAALRWYADAPKVPVLTGGATAVAREVARVQGEFGVTFGTVEPLRIGRVRLPRLGIGYRFGNDLSVFRLVIGEPF